MKDLSRKNGLNLQKDTAEEDHPCFSGREWRKVKQ
jgi:hypothetical protein